MPNKLCIENMQTNDGVSRLFNFSWVFKEKNYRKFYPELKCPWFKLHVNIVKCKEHPNLHSNIAVSFVSQLPMTYCFSNQI
jgi:hypothetical protein